MIAASHLYSPPASRSTMPAAASTFHRAVARTVVPHAKLSGALARQVTIHAVTAEVAARARRSPQRVPAAARKLRCRSSPLATDRSTARPVTRTVADRHPKAGPVGACATDEMPVPETWPRRLPSVGNSGREDTSPPVASATRVLVVRGVDMRRQEVSVLDAGRLPTPRAGTCSTTTCLAIARSVQRRRA